MAQIAIVLRNFVFENEMVSIGVPRQVTNQAMVLMQIRVVRLITAECEEYIFDLVDAVQEFFSVQAILIGVL